MVDDQIGRLHRVDTFRVSPEPDDAVAHGRQVDHGRDSGEILQQDPRRHEGDFLGCTGPRVPAGQRLDVVPCDALPVLVS